MANEGGLLRSTFQHRVVYNHRQVYFQLLSMHPYGRDDEIVDKWIEATDHFAFASNASIPGRAVVTAPTVT